MSQEDIDATFAFVYRLVPEEQRSAAHRLALRYAQDIAAMRAALHNGDSDAKERLLPRLQAEVAALGSLIPVEQRPAAQLLLDDFAEAVMAYAEADMEKRGQEAAVK